MWKTLNYVRAIVKTMTKRAEGLQQAIAYIQLYKSKYPVETLKQQLEQNGYPKDTIDKAVYEVFVGPDRDKTVTDDSKKWRGFSDFKHRRTYTSFGARLGDFLIGFFVTVLAWLLMPFSLLVFIGLIAGIIYLWKRRYYIALGMILAVIPSLVIRWFLGFYGIDYLWRFF